MEKNYEPLDLEALQKENVRLRNLLLEATRPLVSQGLITSPNGVNLEVVKKELESPTPADNVQVKAAEKKKKKANRSRSREKSREKSREERRDREEERKRKEHENLVHENHWQGRMDGRLGNEKSHPVSEKQSLRLRQKHEKKAREPNPALKALPITPKEAELREALVSGVRPFLPGALEMDKSLSVERANSPPQRTSPSPSALDKAREDYKAGEAATLDQRLDSRGAGTGSRPGSRNKSGSRGGSARGGRQKRSSSPSSLMRDTSLPQLVVNTNTEDINNGYNDGFDVTVDSPGGASLGKTTSAGLLMDSSSLKEGPPRRTDLAPPLQTPGAGAGKSSSKAGTSQPAYTPPISQPSDLFPVSSQLYVGLQGTAGHRPMVLTLLASKKPLWKVSGAQAFDPHLHLAAFPPPPNKIVINIFDVGTINPAAGDKYHPQQASFVINVREHTALLYEMVERYSKREEQEREQAIQRRESLTEEVFVPSYSSVVPLVYHPSSLEWWVKHLPKVVIVRAKGDGSLMVRISKAAIEKIVAVKVHEHLDLTGPMPQGAGTRATLVDPIHAISHWWEHRPGPPAALLPHSLSTSSIATPTRVAPAAPERAMSQQEVASIAVATQDVPYSVGMFSSGIGDPRPISKERELPQPAAGQDDPLLIVEPIKEEPSVESVEESPEGATGSIHGASSTKRGKGKSQGGKAGAGGRSVSPIRSSSQEAVDRTPKKVLPVAETYKPMPGRSKAPGFFGNEAQQATGREYAAVAWNDNTDVDRAAIECTVLPGMEMRDEKPVLFKGDGGGTEPASEERARSRSPGKGAKDTIGTAGEEESPKKFAPAVKPDDAARKAIITARNAVSSSTKFRTRKLSETEAGLFRSPFAMPLVTEKIRREAA